MSVDVMRPRRGDKLQRSMLCASHSTVPKLIARAADDGDRASCFVDGSDWSDAQGMIVVVKGEQAARAVYDLLVAHGFVTDGKGVSPGPSSIGAVDRYSDL